MKRREFLKAGLTGAAAFTLSELTALHLNLVFRQRL